MTRVVITKDFPEFEGKTIGEIKEIIQDDPKGSLHEAQYFLFEDTKEFKRRVEDLLKWANKQVGTP